MIAKQCVLPASFPPIDIFPGAKIWVGDVSFLRLDGRSRTVKHMHTSPDIFYVNQGKMTLHVYGRRVVVEAGNMILLPAGVFHSVECRKPAEYYCVNYIARIDEIHDKPKSKPCARWMLSPRVMIGRNSGNLRPLFEAMLEKKFQKKRAGIKIRLNKLIQSIALGFKDSIEISRDKRSEKAGATTYDRRIAESVRYMRRKDLGRFDLAELCRHRMGMSPRNFSRIFKRAMGCSPQKYVLQLKMEKARAMLNKKISAKIVAEKLGYEDIHSFYRVFHRATGHGVLVCRRARSG
ncbi:MAG: AraC family transcriptional regulator [Verrucomicrobia bacterium]|nr:AraC family transcriptional regulator [Verrucomicrobiota bacterium]MBU1735698.1 AraC family transcriptional regulator [Verrucomicrobiota bacterium]MBU1858079.1 AraC family transcriptional regulator [Verrucomicrobiota bacterium]